MVLANLQIIRAECFYNPLKVGIETADIKAEEKMTLPLASAPQNEPDQNPARGQDG
jgi:hypothetical protein